MLQVQDFNTMEMIGIFKVGMLVKSIPEYRLGSTAVPPQLNYQFDGIGIIIEIEWPNKAYVYTDRGETLCLLTERLTSAAQEKNTI